MKVVILCGGQGTRLREETEYKPKPMVEVGGRPIVWHIMQTYARHGFKQFVLALGFKGRVIKEYFVVCGSYFEAIKRGTRAQIETLDMGRRGLHNDGSEILRERLDGKIEIDFDTARRLFTLLCVLHIRS